MVEGFKQYLHDLGRSENTVAAYGRDVVLFLDWCRDSFGEKPAQLYRANVLEYAGVHFLYEKCTGVSSQNGESPPVVFAELE